MQAHTPHVCKQTHTPTHTLQQQLTRSWRGRGAQGSSWSAALWGHSSLRSSQHTSACSCTSWRTSFWCPSSAQCTPGKKRDRRIRFLCFICDSCFCRVSTCDASTFSPLPILFWFFTHCVWTNRWQIMKERLSLPAGSAPTTAWVAVKTKKVDSRSAFIMDWEAVDTWWAFCVGTSNVSQLRWALKPAL